MIGKISQGKVHFNQVKHPDTVQWGHSSEGPRHQAAVKWPLVPSAGPLRGLDLLLERTALRSVFEDNPV